MHGHGHAGVKRGRWRRRRRCIKASLNRCEAEASGIVSLPSSTHSALLLRLRGLAHRTHAHGMLQLHLRLPAVVLVSSRRTDWTAMRLATFGVWSGVLLGKHVGLLVHLLVRVILVCTSRSCVQRFIGRRAALQAVGLAGRRRQQATAHCVGVRRSRAATMTAQRPTKRFVELLRALAHAQWFASELPADCKCEYEPST